MKKIISVLLAVIMMFSAFTVGFMAFAEDAAPEEPADETTVIDDEQAKAAADAAFMFFLGMTYDEFMALDGDAQWEAIQNMDMNKVIILAKGAKYVLKIAKVAIKIILVLDKLHIIDLSQYKQMIVDFIADAIKGIVPPAEETPVEPEAGAAVA